MNKAPERPDLSRKRPPPPDVAARAAETLFRKPVDKITAPGGRQRASIRIHFADHTVIASWRHDPQSRAREMRLLDVLSKAGAAVPKPLGEQDGWIFQSDAGSRRLSAELLRHDGDALDGLAVAAFESLLHIKSLARSHGVLKKTSAIATNPIWLARFASRPRELSALIGLDPPRLDEAALASALGAASDDFIKWDARPGNAAVDADGRVTWFDWEDYGARAGVEDAAFLIADEFWTLHPERSLDLLRRVGFFTAATRPLLIRFATLQAVYRCHLIVAQHKKIGWSSSDDARRHDRIGASPELLSNCAAHGAIFASLDASTAALSHWFEAVAQYAA